MKLKTNQPLFQLNEHLMNHFEPVKSFYKYAQEHNMKLMIKHNNIINIIKQSFIQEYNFRYCS